MELKKLAAAAALDYVQNGMVLGLGTGSTTKFFVDLLGEKLNKGELKNIVGIPTSIATENHARSLGIPLTTLSQNPVLDLAVDGADEVDPALNLIKGLGRALLREKIVETHARQFVVIVDETKMVSRLGTKGALPVEIVKYEADVHVRWLQSTGCRAELWLEDDGKPVETDNGNYLVRCWYPDGIQDVYRLAEQLDRRVGIVEHGLFLDIATQIVVAGMTEIHTLERNS